MSLSSETLDVLEGTHYRRYPSLKLKVYEYEYLPQYIIAQSCACLSGRHPFKCLICCALYFRPAALDAGSARHRQR